MKIAAILPSLKQFGGVRRFLELGNVFVDRGHEFVVRLPDAEELENPDWFEYRGWLGWTPDTEADVVLIGDPPSFPMLQQVDAPAYIYVIAGGKYIQQYQKLYGKHPFLLNNRCFLEHFPEARLVEGGVSTSHFQPRSVGHLRVGYYAGRGAIKGEGSIVSELGDLKHIALKPLVGLANHELPQYYRSLDYFVTWEQCPGWSNTAAEALACGVPVISNGRNT